MKHIAIRVYGLVQGVFFRAEAKRKADELGIVGFARNDPDGTVYIEAQGEEAALRMFVEWCRQGPPRAKVERVDVKEGSGKQFSDFSIE